MDPEERKLLEETAALTQENNKILHSMRRSMRAQRIMTLLYWVIIIGSAVVGYYVLQPYIEQAKNVYGGASSVLNSFKK